MRHPRLSDWDMVEYLPFIFIVKANIYMEKILFSHFLSTTHLRTDIIQNIVMFWNEKKKKN